MQLFVRTVSGRTAVVHGAADEPLAALKARVPVAWLGAPAHLVRLLCGGHELDDARTLRELSLCADSTVHATLRLRGGAPTHVKLVTQRCAKDSVTIELEEGDSSSLVKQRLQAATGVPATDMKIRLGGYNQMVMIDTASNIRVGTSGITKAVQEVDAGMETPESFK